MLVMVTVVGHVDRQLLTILLEPIRHDLKLSDTQMGLLTGTFFSAFYVISGIPLARFFDVGSRRAIIAINTAAYSLATGMCVHRCAGLGSRMRLASNVASWRGNAMLQPQLPVDPT
jgi:predicted MFS family arabinose efflux permease